jgi:hypothetical protein
MLQALINLFKTKKEERVEPVIEPVIPPVESKPEVVNNQITDAVTQVEQPKKAKKPRQAKKK